MERKIRVLRIINRFNIGGPTYNAAFLTKFLGNEYETILVGGLPEEGEADSLFILDKYDVKPILLKEMTREPNFYSDRKAYKKIREIIQKFKPDIVHTHAAKAGALGRRAAAAENVPIILHTFHGHVFHSYFGKVKTLIFKKIERRLASRSTGIIAISPEQKRELTKIHSIVEPEKVEVIPLGFDLKPFNEGKKKYRDAVREELGLKPNQVAVAIVGRLVPIKDHDFFLDVVELLLKMQVRKAKFFIVGDGSEKSHIQERMKFINRKREVVRLMSWVKDMARFNAGMDVICLTSKNEGTPVSLIEAQAGNIPVISTDVGGVKDTIRNLETGIIVKERRPELYASNLCDLINDEQRRTKLSQNGWNHVGQKFHYTTLVTNIDAYYKRLLRMKDIIK